MKDLVRHGGAVVSTVTSQCMGSIPMWVSPRPMSAGIGRWIIDGWVQNGVLRCQRHVNVL